MTPGQLVKAVSIALDMPVETITQHDRNLAIAGVRTMGARGRHAPHATPLDAARLLVATLGSVRVKDSVETLRMFENTQKQPELDWPKVIADSRARGMKVTGEQERHLLGNPRKFSDPAIDALPQTHNFIEGLAALISAASGPIEDLDQYLQRFAEIYIECGGPVWIRARIGHMSQGSASYEQPRPEPSPKKPAQPEVPRYRQYVRYYGVFQKRDVYGVAIMLLGKAFRDGGLPFETTKEAVGALLGLNAPTKSKKKVV
jgi:hypothetical protein